MRRLRAWWPFLVLVAASPVHAQDSTSDEDAVRDPRARAVLDPDTVRVGEAFWLDVSVHAPREAEVEFPPLLRLGAELEQLRPPGIEWDGSGEGGWRARYRLVAWKAGRWSAAAVEVPVDGAARSVTVPPVQVVSVLPAAGEGPLQLQPPRGPWPAGGFPWWLLLLLLLALLVLWWLLRRLRQAPEEEEEEEIAPAIAARRAIEELKRKLEAGQLDVAAYYDGLEEELRRYLAATRAWPPERPVRDFVANPSVIRTPPELRRDLRRMGDRAGLARFAHVSADPPVALRDADVCLAWMSAEEEAA